MFKFFQMCRRFKNYKQPGFSLIEAAISLCIFGIVTATLLPLLASYGQNHKKKETEKTIEEALQSLAAYTLFNKRLPCPAQPNSHGMAAVDCRMPGSFVGVLPFKTLGVPEKKAKDAYGRWLTYAVSPCLTSVELKSINQPKGGTTTKDKLFCGVSPSFSGVSVVDEKGAPVVVSGVDSEFIAIVLVSHGAKGQGAFLDDGTRMPTPSAPKAMNADNSGVFTDRPLCQTVDGYFDDTVRWTTRHMFMAHYGQTMCIDD